MLFIGIGMAASVSPRYELLVSIHKPLGMTILMPCRARIIVVRIPSGRVEERYVRVGAFP